MLIYALTPNYFAPRRAFATLAPLREPGAAPRGGLAKALSSVREACPDLSDHVDSTYGAVDFDGDAFGLLYAIAQRNPSQVISRNPQSGNIAQQRFNAFDARGVAQRVLRDRPLVPRDRQGARFSTDAQNFDQIAVNDVDQLFVAKFHGFGVGGFSDEIGQADPALMRSPGE